jgi:tetratricopeptide (TPR) repeat protein
MKFWCSALLSLTFFSQSGCTSTAGHQTGTQQQTRTVQKTSALSKLEQIQQRMKQGPLKEHEADEYFLLAEDLVSLKQFALARDLFRAVFDSRPTLVTGLKVARLEALLERPSEAENVIQKLILFFPKSPEPPLALAFLAQMRNDNPAELQILAKAYRDHPKNEEVAARYSEELLEQNQKAKALKILEDSLKRMPSSPYFLMKLARLKAEDKKYGEAKQLLDQLLRIAPDSIDGWTLAGYIATEEQNFEAAEKYFREAYDKQPDNDALARFYIAQLLRQNKFPEARRLLAKLEAGADKDHPLDPELIFQSGMVLFQLEEYAEAKQRFLSIADKAGDPGKFFYFAGQCSELLKKAGEARDLYQKIPITSELYPSALQRLIFLTMETGNFPEALNMLGQYEAKQKTNEDSLRFLASAYARMKEYKKAHAILAKGLKLYPNSSELGYLDAAYKEFNESKEASLVALEKFLIKYPDYTPALNHLGYSLAEQGKRLEFAQKLLKHAVAKEPKNGFYLDSLAWVYFKARNYKEAEKNLMLALEREPEEPIILEHLGELKLAQKNISQALKYFQQASKLLAEKPAWKVENDQEWKQSSERVKKRLEELKNMALPTSGAHSPIGRKYVIQPLNSCFARTL